MARPTIEKITEFHLYVKIFSVKSHTSGRHFVLLHVQFLADVSWMLQFAVRGCIDIVCSITGNQGRQCELHEWESSMLYGCHLLMALPLCLGHNELIRVQQPIRTVTSGKGRPTMLSIY